MYKWFLLGLVLTACSTNTVEYKTKIEKVKIEQVQFPDTPADCPRPNYVLVDINGTSYIAQTIPEYKEKLNCNMDRLIYTKKLYSILEYYREVTK